MSRNCYLLFCLPLILLVSCQQPETASVSTPPKIQKQPDPAPIHPISNDYPIPPSSQPRQSASVPAPASPNDRSIEEYLSFIAQIETAKRQLIKTSNEESFAQMTQSKALSNSNDPAEHERVFSMISDSMATQINQWGQIEQRLKQQPTPSSCIRLGTKMANHLAALRQIIEGTQSAFAQSSSNPTASLSALTNHSATSSAYAEQTAQEADAELSSVCSQFGIQKRFDIGADP
jgi:hypothetical protein